MRRLWAAAVLMILMLGGTLVNARYAQQLTDGLAGRLEQAQALACQERWEEAEALTQEVYQDWQEHHFYLHTVMRHSDTDQILRAFRGVLEYLELGEIDQYTAANADLVAQLELLAEMEQATLVNVL